MDEQDAPRSEIDAAEAARALDAIADTRHGVAERVGSPPHYYTKLGATFALMTAAQPFSDAVESVATLAAVALLLWAVRSYSKHTGTWTMATLREPGAWMAWLMIGTMVAGLAAAMITENLVVSLVGALLTLVVAPTLGPRWDAAWVRSLTATDAARDAA